MKFSPFLAKIAVKVDGIKTKVNISPFFSSLLFSLPFGAVAHFFSFSACFKPYPSVTYVVKNTQVTFR